MKLIQLPTGQQNSAGRSCQISTGQGKPHLSHFFHLLTMDTELRASCINDVPLEAVITGYLLHLSLQMLTAFIRSLPPSSPLCHKTKCFPTCSSGTALKWLPIRQLVRPILWAPGHLACRYSTALAVNSPESHPPKPLSAISQRLATAREGVRQKPVPT